MADLLIFCSWQVATLLLASSRNWCLITGKARIWSEGSHWLWEETALQGVGERWPSPLACEKTKPLFPSAASLPKSTAAHTSVASKGNKKSPAPASRLTFFPPSLLPVSVHPGDVGSSMNAWLSLERALCCPVQVPGLTHGRVQQRDSCPCLALPQLGHPDLSRAWAGAGGGSSQCLPMLRDSLGIYKWDSTLLYRQNPCSPETRPS